MKKTILSILSITLLTFANNPMETLYLKNACNSCHGMYGEGMGNTPRLQGISKDKLLERLKKLQAGKTRTAYGAVMISFAKSLDSNQTIEMAKYLSTLKTTIDEDRYDEEYDPNDDGGS
jgi:cytochrome c553